MLCYLVVKIQVREHSLSANGVAKHSVQQPSFLQLQTELMNSV